MSQNNTSRKSFKLQHWQVIAILLTIYDMAAVSLSYLAALWLRFDGKYSLIPQDYLMIWAKFAIPYAVICIALFWVMRLYRSVWRFASYNELLRVTLASIIAAFIHIAGIAVVFSMMGEALVSYDRMPLSYYIGGAGIQFFAILAPRFSYRFLLLERSKRGHHLAEAKATRVMLIGAGSAGQMILRDMHSAHELNDRVLCIIDDNPNKWGRFIDGVEVVGGRDDILAQVEKHKIEKIVLAIPSADMENKRDILNICKETNCELKALPGVYQMVNGEVRTENLKDVQIEDLLGRKPIQVNTDEILTYLKDKVVLVTGGGGSIGSELCRQIAKREPKQLIIFDVYENNAHAIRLELEDTYPNLNLVVLIGSVRDSRRINHVFAKYKPEIVFHAAAHKHVPLMEGSPREAIKNNAIGTYKTAYAAMMNGTKRFVLISTDKAVNPTNIMGASKRLCEMVIQSFDQKIKEGKWHDMPALHTHSEDADGSMHYVREESLAAKEKDFTPCTDFVAVRFGNVLGSNGSVIPRFKEQIAKGGPVTVTHPDIIRYFMTIPEAASLVLQAGTYAKGGEIFVLDMGSAVKIDTLARNLIKLSGLRPDVDIKIEYTGLRPGEKLYEEKLMGEEGLKKTPNDLIHIGSPIPFDTDVFLGQLQMLMDAAYDERADIRDIVMQVVPTYHPAGKHGSETKGSAYEQQIEVMKEKEATEKE